MVGIISYGAYIPLWRLSRDAIVLWIITHSQGSALLPQNTDENIGVTDGNQWSLWYLKNQ